MKYTVAGDSAEERPVLSERAQRILYRRRRRGLTTIILASVTSAVLLFANAEVPEGVFSPAVIFWGIVLSLIATGIWYLLVIWIQDPWPESTRICFSCGWVVPRALFAPGEPTITCRRCKHSWVPDRCH